MKSKIASILLSLAVIIASGFGIKNQILKSSESDLKSKNSQLESELSALKRDFEKADKDRTKIENDLNLAKQAISNAQAEIYARAGFLDWPGQGSKSKEYYFLVLAASVGPPSPLTQTGTTYYILFDLNAKRFLAIRDENVRMMETGIVIKVSWKQDGSRVKEYLREQKRDEVLERFKQ